MNSCFGLALGALMRRAKRIMASQNYGKFYPHSILTIVLQMHVAFNETEKFAKVWCSSGFPGNEIKAVKEIFEVENKDDAVWTAELLSNKYVAENVDRLIYIVSIVKR